MKIILNKESTIRSLNISLGKAHSYMEEIVNLCDKKINDIIKDLEKEQISQNYPIAKISDFILADYRPTEEGFSIIMNHRNTTRAQLTIETDRNVTKITRIKRSM